MIRLDQSGVEASGEKGGISERYKNITEREKPFQKRKENCSEKIRAESKKISADQSGARSVVQNDAEQGEGPTREGIQTMAAKYTGQWKIM